MYISIENLFGENGYLAKQIDNFETRKGQFEMAKDIRRFLGDVDNNVFMGEGEVGIGKSMAYLLTSLFDSKVTTPILVSTSSITLQNQLVNKDLKDVAEIYEKITDNQLRYTSFKGKNNYVCLKEYGSAKYVGVDNLHRDVREDYEKIISLVEGENDYDGRKPDRIDNRLWNRITTDTYSCTGKDCSKFMDCYYYKIKRDIEAKKYDVVVVNHSLAVADYHIKRITGQNTKILPETDLFIIDEAHHFEQFALGFFTKILSKRVFDKLESKFESVINDENSDTSSRYMEKTKDVFSEALSIYQSIPMERLISRLEKLAVKYDDKLIEDSVDLGNYDWVNDFRKIINTLRKAADTEEELPGEVKVMIRRLTDIIFRFEWLLENDESIAIRGEVTDYSKRIKLSKINISDILKDFWDSGRKFILTSATLSFNKKFDYLADRLGIDKYKMTGGIYESSFDYKKQAKLYVPKGFSPKNRNFDEQLLEGVKNIINSSPFEKTLLLFTSYRQMYNLKPELEKEFEDEYLILHQSNEYSKEYLLNQFRNSDKAILIGQAASFGTGVDIKGNKNIILAKLNFDRPNDPLFKAQSNLLEARGKNPFMDLSIPNVSMRTKQQVGRSIRSLTDKAFIVIFDDRLVTTHWGKLIVRSLPVNT